MNVLYKQNCSTLTEISKHFNLCDNIFLENLKKRVVLKQYIEKIYYKSQRLEAWHKNNLVGLLAVYVDKNKAYITNISVIPELNNQGIGSSLLTFLINKYPEIQTILLEVNKSNKKAINFYKKHHFKQISDNENTLLWRFDKK